MRFRLKAFAAHLFSSCALLLLVLGTLYAGWYHWPGWYLTGVLPVVAVMVGVDVCLGPSLTLIIADPAKPRRVLGRDIGLIAAVQIIALVYGALQLWHGRPLYYAFSENCLSIVQAYDIEQDSLAAARKAGSAYVPHWNSTPRWIWAPLPQDSQTAGKIVASAIARGYDVTAMPVYYKPWSAGLAELRRELKPVAEIKFFSDKEKKLLRQRMAAAGLAPDQSNGIALTGRGRPLLAVFDPQSLKMLSLLEAT